TIEYAARDADDGQSGDGADVDDAAVANRPVVANNGLQILDHWTARISDESFERSIFGNEKPADIRQKLGQRLQLQVDRLGEQYSLTPRQKERLMLAGRGDIKELFDQIDELRCRTTSTTMHDVDSVRQLSRVLSAESKAFWTSASPGPFGQRSFFA